MSPYRTPERPRGRRIRDRSWREHVSEIGCRILGHSWWQLFWPWNSPDRGDPVRNPKICLRCCLVDLDGLTDEQFLSALERARDWFAQNTSGD